VKIINLAEAPQHIPRIAQWHHAEWGYLNPGATVGDRIEKMQRYLKGSSIPVMYIAVDGNELLGTAALVESDMYVNAVYRRRGIGAALVNKVAEVSKQQGTKALYLFTPDQEHFYAGLGWQYIANESYRGGNATLMKLKL
jgi:GNAT superfamily N-acetyltransferase